MLSEYEEIVQLCNALRAARSFSKKTARNEVRLLDHLLKHWPPTSRRHLTVTAIARDVLGNKPDRNGLAAARQAIHRLRLHIDLFYKQGEGKKSSRCLKLPAGVPYLLEVGPNDEAFDALDAFWDPYFLGDFENIIVWAEPLVFFDEKSRIYVRFLDVNCEESDPDRVGEMKAPSGHPAATPNMVPCFHYQSSGDIAAVHALQDWFTRREVEISPRVTRDTGDSAIVGANAIILGNMRTNRYVKRLQRDLDFVVDTDSVVIRKPRQLSGEEDRYIDYRPSRELNRGWVDGFAYAVLSRRPNENERACATIVAANHGRALQKVTEYLVTRLRMMELFNAYFRSGHSKWPTTFQVVFRVKIGRGMVFQDAEPIASRIYAV